MRIYMRFSFLFLLLFRALIGEEILDRQNWRDTMCRGAVYYCSGSLFGTLSLLGRVGFGLCQLLPQKAISGNEWLLFSDLCSQATGFAFTGLGKRGNWQQTWRQNRDLLGYVPVFTQEDEYLVHFLQNRWLVKMAGISQIGLNWVYPCFGIIPQANPTSNHAYARLASSHMTQVYKKRMQTWKQQLGIKDPLILTRSSDMGTFLPSYISIAPNETIKAIVQKLTNRAIVDFTDFLPVHGSSWQQSFSKQCWKRGLNIEEIICIERVKGDGIGGVRILPLPHHSFHTATKQHDNLLECISTLGLIANRIELDREPGWLIEGERASFSIHRPDRREFLAQLDSFANQCRETSDYMKPLIEGTFEILKGLFKGISEIKWHRVLESPTKSFITWLSMAKIKNQLEQLCKNLDKPFFDIALLCEEVHADLSALLEVLRPFSAGDFGQIYRDQVAIPALLNELTSYGIHSSGMTCFAAIIKAVERKEGKVHAIYGENSYFECTRALEKLADSFSRSDTATQEEWAQANLLLVQYNPAIRIDRKFEHYQLENIEAMVRKSLKGRKGNLLTVAIDGTLDLITSPKVTHFLNTFSKEILDGTLNVVVFRTGNKFDLLGMDNYCGAPFFLISKEAGSFDFFFTEPILQCDELSLNWFCLAYRHIIPQLDQYQKQICANTRSLLEKVPEKLEKMSARYRIVPMNGDINPAFIDIKVSGPFQKIKAVSLVIPYLFLESMKKKQPIFNRPSVGFYHPNISVIFGEEGPTIRLTLGLDPAQVDTFSKCFEKIATL